MTFCKAIGMPWSKLEQKTQVTIPLCAFRLKKGRLSTITSLVAGKVFKSPPIPRRYFSQSYRKQKSQLKPAPNFVEKAPIGKVIPKLVSMAKPLSYRILNCLFSLLFAKKFEYFEFGYLRSRRVALRDS